MSHGPPHTFLAPAFYTNFMNQPQAATYPTASQTAPAAMIPGSNDLEKLENLKNIIKSGQHQLFTTEPKPDALAALYLGQIPHPEQETMLEDSASRPPRLQGKEMARKPLQNNHYQNQGGQASNSVDVSPYAALKTSNYPSDIKPVVEHEDEPTTPVASLAARISDDDKRGNAQYPSSVDAKPYADPYMDESTSREFIPARRDSAAVPPPGNSSGLPPPSGRDPRYYDPKDHDRERDSWDRDRRYDRDDRRGSVSSDSRRYEPDLYPPRRYDEDRRRDDRDRLNPRPFEDRDRYPFSSQRIDDRYQTRPDDRDYDRRATYPDDRRVDPHAPSADSRVSARNGAPLSVSTVSPSAVGPGTRSVVDDRNGRSQTSPMIPSQLDEKTRAPTLEERISTRVPTLQERLNQPPVKGGTTPPTQPAAHNNANITASPTTATPGRQQPTLEQRLSQGPTGAGVNGSASDPLKNAGLDRDHDVRDPRERSVSGASAISPSTAAPTPLVTEERGRTLTREMFPPSGARLPAPPTRTEPRGRYPTRSRSMARDTTHGRSSSVAPSAREPSPTPSVGGGGSRQDTYRAGTLPPREHSRERTSSASVPPPGTNSYRPDDRAYVDRERERDRMDVDARYPDRHSRYTPPDRDRTRVSSASGRASPPHHYPSSYDDRDRRVPPPATRDYPPYDYERRRDWTSAEEDPYWKSRSTYPPPEKERYEREPPYSSSSSTRAIGWETRAEHDSRRAAQLNNYPPARSAESVRERDSLPARPPTGGAKLDYPAPAPYDDRERYERLKYNVNPHNHPQSAVALASFSSRVRQRSPSPVRRSNSSVVDDRPPSKRPREDYPQPPTGPSAATYTRPREPPAYSSAPARYPAEYDRAPPPAADYRRSEYPATYERPRSPARGMASGGYSNNYRPDPRDDRRYMPPPPPPR
ncbi:hypothetical protein Moror_661 [Moniliophthora roreri MCA 2997]|uniref:Uncharacterized protein n=1 Tax=Moniliophthora roreri (strain MCA 2997) TaxID=1381753 RepID=V2WWX3_MONRO|nr:hypothetical protein Moror_661 [Moniliophthora roreri MCA 2997]